MRTIGSISALALALAAGSSLAAGEGISYQATPCAGAQVSSPGDYRVFIDKPTGFAFVCTPAGWKFARATAASTREEPVAQHPQPTPVMVQR
jgi:hypothetical protein